MRRHPVYIVIDVAECNAKVCAMQVQNGITDVIKSFKGNPYALETAWVSIISFSNEGVSVFPLTEVSNLKCPTIRIGGSKGLGYAIDAVTKEIVSSYIDCDASSDNKPDCSPKVLLFTDGECNDDVNGCLDMWRDAPPHKSELYAITLGKYINSPQLACIAQCVRRQVDCSVSTWTKLFFMFS